MNIEVNNGEFVFDLHAGSYLYFKGENHEKFSEWGDLTDDLKEKLTGIHDDLQTHLDQAAKDISRLVP